MADTSLIGAGAVACAIGVVSGLVAVKTQRDHRRWCAARPKVSGVVSRLAQRRSTGLSEDASGMSTGTHYTTVPVVRYRAANRIEYEIDAPEAPSEIGSAVEVAYDPELPSEARAVMRTPKVGCSVFLVIVGLVLVAIGIYR